MGLFFLVIFVFHCVFIGTFFIMAASGVNKYAQEKYFEEMVPDNHGK